MMSIIQDSGFTRFLDSRNLRLIDNGREDTDYYYYDLLDTTDTRIGAFGVQKFIGEVYLLDGEDVPVGSLKALDITTEKKN